MTYATRPSLLDALGRPFDKIQLADETNDLWLPLGPNNPMPSAIYDGTTIANNVLGDSGQNGQIVYGSRKDVPFTTTIPADLAVTDCSNYRYVSVHIVAQGGSSNVTFNTSNDNVNFLPFALISAAAVGTSGGLTNTGSAGLILHGPIPGRYFKLTVSTIASGTTSGSVQFYSIAPPPIAIAAAASQSGTWAITGSAAHSAASSGNPVRIAGRVNAAVDTTLVAGDVSDLFITKSGAAVIKPFAVPETDWSYAAASGGISNTTTAVTIKTAGAAGVRNYITGIQLSSDPLGAATELAIRDGAAGTVLWRMKIGTAGIVNGLNILFQTPLQGTAATLLEVVTLAASITGGVFFNAQGYQAP